MQNTRSPRIPMPEQIRLINECRRSGMTDADWCREQGIAPSTFYSWVKRCRKAGSQIQPADYGSSATPREKQDIVAIEVIPDSKPTSAVPAQAQPDTHLDNSHTIEVVWNGITLRITNQADPSLLAKTLRTFQEVLC